MSNTNSPFSKNDPDADDPLSELNTPENMELRAKALEIHSRGPVAELALEDLVEMLELFHASSGEYQERSDQIPDEISIIRYAQQHYGAETLDDLRTLFRERVFPAELILKWVNSAANIRALTANALLEGYPEFVIATTTGPFRSAPDMLEYLRRKFVDNDPAAEDFGGIYDHEG